jgi:hypothetical protein
VDDFKPISREAIPLALEKAERYRLLNEPPQAESICLDVLAADPDNQQALVMLLLALTDQFRTDPAECVSQAQAVIPRLHDKYEQLYYSGIICERRGHAVAVQAAVGSSAAAFDWVRRAMDFYEQAEQIRPPGNDDAILRWNHCLRLCQRYHLHAEEEEEMREPALSDG